MFDSSQPESVFAMIILVYMGVFLVLRVISLYIYRSVCHAEQSDFFKNENLKSIHQWGYRDTEFKFEDENNVVMTGDRYLLCGKRLPYILPFLKSKIGNFDTTSKKQERNVDVIYENIAAKKQHQLTKEVVEFVQQNSIIHSLEGKDRLFHSHGQLSVDEVYELTFGNKEFDVVDMVVWPDNENDLGLLFELASTHNGRIKMVPYGGGTNVTGCLKINRYHDNNEMFISVDMSRFNNLESIDENNMYAVLGAGMTGEQIEAVLNRLGFTMGHEPDSYEFSTLGGWISTYASGMKRGKYGNIEDIVIGIRGVSPVGKFNFSHFSSSGTEVPVRSSHGIDMKQIFFGSEGNLAVITYATVKIKLLPDMKKYQSVVFNNMEHGVNFLQCIYDSEIMPASIRLVDNNQFQMAQAFKPKKTGFFEIFKDKLTKFALRHVYGFDFNTMVAATIVFEGTEDAVNYQEKMVAKFAKKNKGIMGGSENGRAGYLLTSAIAYIRDFVNKYNIIAETFETSCVWDNILDMTTEMNIRIDDLQKELGLKSKPFLTYRVTQLYECGVCLYFTLAVHDESGNLCDLYSRIEDEMRIIMKKYTTSVSHHHGIGKLKSKWMHYDDLQKKIVHGIKNEIDPDNIMAARNGFLL